MQLLLKKHTLSYRSIIRLSLNSCEAVKAMIARLMIAIGVLEIVFATLFLIIGLLVQPSDIPVYGDFVSSTYCGDGERLCGWRGLKTMMARKAFIFIAKIAMGFSKNQSQMA